MRICGIDPGLTGGIVLLSKKGKILGAWPMPAIENMLDLPKLNNLIKKIKENCDKNGKELFVHLEQVSAMPKQGAVSGFKFGRVYGMVEAILVPYGIKYELTQSRKWTKVMMAGVEQIKRTVTHKKGKNKGKTSVVRDIKAERLVALSRLFPDDNLPTMGVKVKKPHEGCVDALLIAEYGRRQRF